MHSNSLIKINNLSLLTDFSIRNQFINELTNSEKNDKSYINKLILAAWLGSNIAIYHIKHEIGLVVTNRDFANIGYVCFSALEKSALQLSTISSLEAQSAINNIYLSLARILHRYISNYQIVDLNRFDKASNVINASHQVMDFFQKLVADIAAATEAIYTSSEINHILTQARMVCINRIKTPLYFLDHPIFNTKPLYRFPELNVQERLDKMLIKLVTNLRCNRAIYSHYLMLRMSEDYKITRVILPSEDGVLVDGLHIHKRGHSKKQIVLALVGHFESTHTYITKSLVKFCHLFGDVIFINHRNYSDLSSTMARSIDDLAKDVVAFARFYQGKKHIRLYGMCGGSVAMIPAALLLEKENIPYKLIIDRFFTHYTDSIHFKRAVMLSRIADITKQSISLLPLVAMVWVHLFLVMLSFFIRKNTDFGKLIKSIPDEKLLILQAKPSIKESTYPEYSDHFIHPDNNIRTAYKDIRKEKKLILKKLADECRYIAHCFHTYSSMRIIFINMTICFSAYLRIISDEKLAYQIESKKYGPVEDLHSLKLFELKPRSGVSMSRFVQGFFAADDINLKLKLMRLKPYSADEILNALKVSHESALEKKSSIEETAERLANLFNKIAKHVPMIDAMAKRARYMEKGVDIFPWLTDLMNSDWFYALENPRPKIKYVS